MNVEKHDCLRDRAIVASQAKVTVQKPTQLNAESPFIAPASAGSVHLVLIDVFAVVGVHNVQTDNSITSVPVQFGTMPNAEGRKVALITGRLFFVQILACYLCSEPEHQPDPPALLLLQAFADRMAATSRSCCWRRVTLCMVRERLTKRAGRRDMWPTQLRWSSAAGRDQS
jgi:hypothetical protein